MVSETPRHTDGWWRSRWMWLGVALVLLVALGLAFSRWLENSGPRTIEGVVRCASGNAVQGFWVVDKSDAPSGWASWQPAPDDPALATFSREVYGREYAVHVGCGGDRKQWAENVRSPFLKDDRVELVCHDESDDLRYRRCEPQAVQVSG